MSDTETETETPGDEPSPPVSEPPRARLYRNRRRRLVAGVAAGLADRFDIDVSIVRVVFVVLALLWGFGVALYLAMWVFVPAREDLGDDDVEPPVGISIGLLVALVVAVGLAVAVFFTTVGGVPQVGRNLVWVWFGFLAVLLVLSVRRPTHHATLGRLLVIALIGVVTLALLVVGGLLAFLATTDVPLTGGNGARSWQPTTLAATQHAYRVEFGSGSVDLSGVQFSPAGFTVSASVGVGNLTVILPSDAVVDLRTRIGAGSVDEWNNLNTGEPFTPNPPGARALAGLPHVTVNASVGIGHINIARAGPTP